MEDRLGGVGVLEEGTNIDEITSAAYYDDRFFFKHSGFFEYYCYITVFDT